jgi:hypothetical protein
MTQPYINDYLLCLYRPPLLSNPWVTKATDPSGHRIWKRHRRPQWRDNESNDGVVIVVVTGIEETPGFTTGICCCLD